MRVGQAIELLVHRRQHVRMRVAETRYGRAGGSIDIFLASTVSDDDAPGTRGGGVSMAGLAMKDTGHDCCS